MNNFVGGWHSQCLRHFGVGKNFWEFILRLQNMELQKMALLQQQAAGEDISNRTSRQKRKETKIRSMINNYSDGVYADDLTYLKALGQL